MSWVERTKNRDTGGLDEATLNSEAVIFLRGKNSFGDPIWSYLKLTVRSFAEMQKRIQNGEQFHPSEFGEMLYAGQNEPPQDIRDYMQQTYDLVDMKMPDAGDELIPQPVPSLWNDDEDEEIDWDFQNR